MISSRELFLGPEQSENTHLVLREFVLVDGMFPLRGPALVATVNQTLDSKLSNAEDPTLRMNSRERGTGLLTVALAAVYCLFERKSSDWKTCFGY